MNESLLSKKVHTGDALAHYARACTDIVFNFPFGQQELMGVAARGCYDLTQHSNSSGKMLEYFDASTNVKFIPHVIEPSIGVDRLFLAILTSSYREEVVENEKRVFLGFHPAIAPIKAAVFPLVSNKPEIVQIAKNVLQKIQKRYHAEYDTSGAIGRRYRRADESGIPFCITVDYESLEDQSITLRFRDSMKQVRIKIDDLLEYITNMIEDS